MAKYATLYNFTDQGIRAVKESPARLKAAIEMAGGAGMTVLDVYYTAGPYDLIVISEADELVMKSAKNIPWVKVLRSEGLNVYDILCYDKLIMVGDAIDKIEGGL